MQQFQAGDVDAFTCLYQRHNQAVRDVCSGRLRDPALTEDAVQETFARALTALPTFTDGALFEHWLKRVAVNHCRDVLRRHERRNVPLDVEAVKIADAASEAEVLQCIQRDAVSNVLRSLSQRDAAVLVAHHVNGEPVTALAQRWGQTAGAMKVTLHRARTRFRDLSTGVLGLGPMGLLRRWCRHVATTVRQMDGAVTAGATSMPTAAMQIIVAVTLTAGGPAMAMAATLAHVTGPTTPSTVAIAGETPSALTGLDGWRDRVDADRAAVAVSPGSKQRQPARSEAQDSRPPVEFAPVYVPVANQRVQQTPTGKPAYQYGARISAGPVDETPVIMEPKEESPIEPVHEPACDVAAALPTVTYCTR